MGDVAKGIKSFKKGMSTDPTDDQQEKNITENTENKDSSNQDTNNQDTNNKD